MDAKECIRYHFSESIRTKQLLLEHCERAVVEIAQRMMATFKAGGKVLVCGNGGSAADAQHLAGELVGRFLTERYPLPCIALTTDTSIMTAVGNDYGFEKVFSRQVDALAQPGDCLIAISTSGNSPNIIAAILEARSKKCTIFTLGGKDGGAMTSMADVAIVVPSNATPRIQEGHGLIIHVLCALIDDIIAATPANPETVH